MYRGGGVGSSKRRLKRVWPHDSQQRRAGGCNAGAVVVVGNGKQRVAWGVCCV